MTPKEVASRWKPRSIPVVRRLPQEMPPGKSEAEGRYRASSRRSLRVANSFLSQWSLSCRSNNLGKYLADQLCRRQLLFELSIWEGTSIQRLAEITVSVSSKLVPVWYWGWTYVCERGAIRSPRSKRTWVWEFYYVKRFAMIISLATDIIAVPL